MWDGCRCAPQQKKPAQWETHTPSLANSPYSLKLEKRCRWNARKGIRSRLCHWLTDVLPEIVLPLPPRWLICGFIGSGEACLCRESGGVPLRPLWASGHWEGMSSVSPGTNLPRWFGATSEFTALRKPAVVNVAYGTEMVQGWVWSVGVGTTLSEYPSPLLSTPESLFQKLFVYLFALGLSFIFTIWAPREAHTFGTWDLCSLQRHVNSWLRHVGSSSLTPDWTQAPALEVWSLSHWTTWEVLRDPVFKIERRRSGQPLRHCPECSPFPVSLGPSWACCILSALGDQPRNWAPAKGSTPWTHVHGHIPAWSRARLCWRVAEG